MASGVVEGYDVAEHRVDNVVSAPSLRVRIDEIVVGNIGRGTTRVVFLFYGPTVRAIGDLDFRHFDPTPDRTYDFLHFEVTRVLLKVAEGMVKQRVVRLENLAYFQGFADNSRARDVYDQAISTSGVTRSQGRKLREHFEQVRKTR
jgi:hypothetical protein